MEGGAILYTTVSGGDGIIEYPGTIPRLKGQVVLVFHKSAQIPGLYRPANIPQSPDAVEKRIFFVGDVCDLIFGVHNVVSSLPWEDAPPSWTVHLLYSSMFFPIWSTLFEPFISSASFI